MIEPLTVAFALPLRDRPDVARLVEALNRQKNIGATLLETTELAGISADFVVADLGPNPTHGLSALPRQLMPRLVSFAVDRAFGASLVRRYDLAAIVEYDGWRGWAAGWNVPGTLIGRRSLSARYGLFADFGDPNYVILGGRQLNLPELLATYLRDIRSRVE